ncbi:glycosyltransferase family 2 protein [Sphingobacterium wenxiniae]|uniref:Glycosyltransferase involved in cell wall bisynthesis n=1 Tax=Sphingobacterium wenxiniae TaxID=683125 RepID=A0A1I6U905_9SPHI|nr:glycosyltransferase family 2 protein [Sphingobacterium wenxiniae]SFS97757.1 Glycosyltransferase involved in cell wall bisynthesis [Sphingobacterium wenxiniae]
MDLISVIIPIYNVEAYLRECLDAVINQSYTNLEIILINDGSTDSSSLICEEYAKVDHRIVIINQENAGPSAARNSGLEKSTGAYIAFIDSDDAVHSDLFTVLYNKIEHADIAVCDYLRFEDKIPITVTAPMNVDTVEIKKCSGREMNLSLFDNKVNLLAIVVWAKLYRRQLWETVRYPVGRLHEDEAVIHKIYAQANNVHIVALKLFFYRDREGSITNSKALKSVLDSYEAFKGRAAFFAEKGDAELMGKSYNAQMATLLRLEISNQDPLLVSLSISDILKEDLYYRVKLGLVCKKIFPAFYNFLRRNFAK